jgi:hypothetical protein
VEEEVGSVPRDPASSIDVAMNVLFHMMMIY